MDYRSVFAFVECYFIWSHPFISQGTLRMFFDMEGKNASNHEPKFLANDTGVIAELPTWRLEIVTLVSCLDVPMI